MIEELRKGNPIHKDMIAAARMADLAFICNVVIDEEKKTVAAFAGNFETAHQKGCDFFYRIIADEPTIEDAYQKFLATEQNDTAPDQWCSQILARIVRKHKVIFVAEPPICRQGMRKG